MEDAEKSEQLPSQVYATAILPTLSGKSLYNSSLGDRKNIQGFYTDWNTVERAMKRLEEVGFQVWYTPPEQSRLKTKSDFQPGVQPNLLIAGSPDLFFDVLGISLKTKELGPKKRQSTHLVFGNKALSSDAETGYLSISKPSNDTLAGVVDGIALSAPARLFTPSPTPPPSTVFHLTLPDELAAYLNADKAYQRGYTGEGVRVAMIDTGHFWHPFFQNCGYIRDPVVPSLPIVNPNQDEHGHGTGESANLYAVAPGSTLIPVKAMLAGPPGQTVRDRLIAVTQAFKIAANLNPPPDVITCSWGYDLHNRNDMVRYDAIALELAVKDAIARNIIVVFAVGNEGVRGFPAQQPDVIAVGGAYKSNPDNLQASDLASAFKSKIYTNRKVPDVCGLVGSSPSRQYLMLPVPPGSKQDKLCSAGDGTNPDDGWAVFSGTSAAAPQVAGVIALMLQANPNLLPQDVKEILQKTATDVVQGKAASCGGSQPKAGPGFDSATGAGLVDANTAVDCAKTYP